MIQLALVCLVVLVGIWLVYPAAIMLLALRRTPDDTVPPDELPFVSVIIASREPPRVIEGRIADCLAGTYPSDRMEVVVALDYSAALVCDSVVVTDSRVSVVQGDAPGGKPSTLNAAVRIAKGDLLVFTDAYQRFAPEAIRELVASVSTGRYAMVSGTLELSDGDAAPSLVERYWRFETRLRRDETALHSAVGVSGAIYVMTRTLWAPLPAALILDDLFLPLRLVLGGHRIGFSARAFARDGRRSTPRSEYRRKVRTLTGIIQICVLLPRVLLPWRNPIWLQFVCHKLLRLVTPWLFIGLCVGLAGVAVRAFGTAEVTEAVVVTLLVCLALALSGKATALVDAIRWMMVMQAAILVATFNGLTGRWDVWRR